LSCVFTAGAIHCFIPYVGLWRSGCSYPAIFNRRQLVIGIANKKFSQQSSQQSSRQSSRQSYQLDLDLPAEGHAGPEHEEPTGGEGGGFAGRMPKALHWQASHNPRTGNAVCAGTVNFNQRMPDVDLQ
jgi:hypothetical protein